MIAQELRPGNWLLYNEDGNWRPLELNFVAKDEAGFKGWYANFGWCATTLEDIFNDGELDVKPIVLTPEILEKAGFISNAIGYYHLGDIYISYANSGLHEYQFRDYPVRFKHLHQLQNLHFALTGQELTIKL